MTIFCPGCHERTSPEVCANCNAAPLLDERYVLLDQLGQGASGFTWKAFDQELECVVAIKELSIRRLEKFKIMELFEREARTMASLSHPNVPKFYRDFMVEDGRHIALYLVQEFVDGHALTLEARWTEDEARKLLESVLGTLGYLHSLSPAVIHRDIKPSNIMRRKTGEYVLIDFGSTRAALGDASIGGSTVAGTFGYMAPEQFQGRADESTDIYGLGATVIALLSGTDASGIVVPLKPGTWRRFVNVSGRLQDVLEKMVAPERSERLKSVEDVQRALRQPRAAREALTELGDGFVKSAERKEPKTPVEADSKSSPTREFIVGPPFCDEKEWNEQNWLFAWMSHSPILGYLLVAAGLGVTSPLFLATEDSLFGDDPSLFIPMFLAIAIISIAGLLLFNFLYDLRWGGGDAQRRSFLRKARWAGAWGRIQEFFCLPRFDTFVISVALFSVPIIGLWIVFQGWHWSFGVVFVLFILTHVLGNLPVGRNRLLDFEKINHASTRLLAEEVWARLPVHHEDAKFGSNYDPSNPASVLASRRLELSEEGRDVVDAIELMGRLSRFIDAVEYLERFRRRPTEQTIRVMRYAALREASIGSINFGWQIWLAANEMEETLKSGVQ